MSERIVNTNGAAIYVTESGVAEPALVFLHYWGGSSRTWQDVVDRLGETRRVIVLDQRGWGNSVATDGRYGLAAMADDVEAVAHTFGLKRYALVGHSMGGKVAQIVATRRPKGLLGLILIAPAPPTPMPVPEEQRAAMLGSYGSREGVLHGNRQVAVPCWGRRDTRTIDHYCRNITASNMLRYPTLLHSALPHSHSMLSSHERLDLASQFFPRLVKNRPPDTSKLCALDFKREFRDSKSARFQRLSASIGRISIAAATNRDLA
jgi:pimeloyl-ACP methyl ester carboxylesterase